MLIHTPDQKAHHLLYIQSFYWSFISHSVSFGWGVTGNIRLMKKIGKDQGHLDHADICPEGNESISKRTSYDKEFGQFLSLVPQR